MSEIDKNAIARNFSEASGTYNFSAPAQADIAIKLAAYIGQHSKATVCGMADFGCGTGFMSAQLRRLFPTSELTCVDLAQGMLEKCEKFIGQHNAKFIKGDIENVSFDEGFDLIASNYVLQWSDRVRAIGNIEHLLNSGGTAALAVPVAGSFRELHDAYKKVCGYELEGINYPESHVYLDIFTGNNFRIIHSSENSYTVKFPSAMSALRSLKRIGANFSRHKNYKLLSPGKVIRLLEEYENKARGDDGRVGLTYQTLYVIAQKD